MEEKIKLLNPNLTGDCTNNIIKEIKELNKLKDRIYSLTDEKIELEKEYNVRYKKLSSLVGVVFDFLKEEKNVDYTINKTNIVFNNVNGGSKR